MDLHEKLIEFGYSQDLYQGTIDYAYRRIINEAPTNPKSDYMIRFPLADHKRLGGIASIGFCNNLYLILKFRKEYSGFVGADQWRLVDYDICEDREKSRSYKSISGKNLRAAVER
ncbi:hypothetical protein GOQ04_03415 [Emticicia sp. ODNR4P]|nr:hypothetical protein [Emticicia sp. ODNR4P]